MLIISQLWAGPLSQNRFVILFVNRKQYDLEMTAHWSDVGIPNDTIVLARDLWLHQDLSDILIGNFSVTVKSHSCKMFILTLHY
ncbi:Alpha-galactosidase 1-like protein [Drosera capensis]